MVILLQHTHVDEILEHAREAAPRECCGLIGGVGARALATYRLRNVATNPFTAYEAAPEDLFAAQLTIRERGQQLMAIYHSHPRANDPTPSATDVRLAYYPSAVYFIVGLGSEQPCLRAFRISEREGSWETAEYEILAEANY